MSSGSISISGELRIESPASAAHSSLARSGHRVRIELFILPELKQPQHATRDGYPTLAPPPPMSMANRGLAPSQTIILDQPVDTSQPAEKAGDEDVYRFNFSSIPSNAWIHVIAYTDPLNIGRYEQPTTQAIGWAMRAAGVSSVKRDADEVGDEGWPWGTIYTGSANQSTIQLEPFWLRAPHDMLLLREATIWTALHGCDPQRCISGVDPKLFPTQAVGGWLRPLSRNSAIPVLTLRAVPPRMRGHAHGLLLAPYILDFFRFYVIEARFHSSRSRYEKYAQEYAHPSRGFFNYPPSYMEEAEGLVAGMVESGCRMWIPELARDFAIVDVLAMFIETRTVIGREGTTQQHRAQTQQQQSAGEQKMASNEPSSPSLSHHCSQVVVWGRHTSSASATTGPVLAGRNMDGEIDLRKVTVSHTLLIAFEREKTATSTSSGSSNTAQQSYRYISCMWPGTLVTLTGCNETGLYMCENAGETQPGTGVVSGLTPVACVQAQLLRSVDARTLNKQRLLDFLRQYNSSEGWDATSGKRISAEERKALLDALGVTMYWTEDGLGDGGFSGPGSIFVIATPPKSSNAQGTSTSSSTSSTSSPPAMIVECERSHTHVRLPGDAPPFHMDAMLATNHFMTLGFNDRGVLHPDEEQQRAPIAPRQQCATLNPVATPASPSLWTNWNEPIAFSSLWRFQAGLHAMEAMHRQQTKFESSHVQQLLATMCPGVTEHAFMCELHADGRVQVHVAVADTRAGMWDAPYLTWHSFDFHQLFIEQDDAPKQ